MNDDQILEELLLCVTARREMGLEVTLSEICKDYPHLEDRLRRELELLEKLDAQFSHHDQLPAAPAVAVSSRPQMVGPYQTERKIGQGSFGEVLLATDTVLQRYVALKRLLFAAANKDDAQKEEARLRFLVEAQVTGRLDHPGVVPIHGLVYDEKQNPSYAMRLIRGESLDGAIARFHRDHPNGANSPNYATDLQSLLRSFLTVCQTVAFAHSQGFLHRDLKPENIMVGHYGETLVVDWGLAKRFKEESDVASLEETSTAAPAHETALDHQIEALEKTLQGRRKGSPAYMSPEQAAGSWSEVGPRSDVYSLGAILYKLLCGQLPFRDPKKVFQQIAAGEFPPPREARADIPFGLEAICLKAMSRERWKRYASAQELAADIERWLADEPVLAAPEPWGMRLQRWLKRNQTILAAVVPVLVMAAVALGGYAGIQASHASQLEIAYDKVSKSEENLRKTNIEIDATLLRERMAHEKEEQSYLAAKQAILRVTREVIGQPQLGGQQLTPMQMQLLLGVLKGYEELRVIRKDDMALRQEAALIRLFVARRPYTSHGWDVVEKEVAKLRPEIEAIYADAPHDATSRYLIAELRLTEAMGQLLQLPKGATFAARAALGKSLLAAREHLEALVASKVRLSLDPTLVDMLGPPICDLTNCHMYAYLLARYERNPEAKNTALKFLAREVRSTEGWFPARRDEHSIVPLNYAYMAYATINFHIDEMQYDEAIDLAFEARYQLELRLASEATPVQLAFMLAEIEAAQGKSYVGQYKLKDAIKCLSEAANRYRQLLPHGADPEWFTDESFRLRARLIETLKDHALYSLILGGPDKDGAKPSLVEAQEHLDEIEKQFPKSVDALKEVSAEVKRLRKTVDK